MTKTLRFFFMMAFVGPMVFAQPFASIQNIDPNTGNEPYEIASGDLDDDGFIDIVMATYDYNGGTPAQDYIKWYKNDGSGNFALQTTVSSTIQWVDGLIIANIDGQFGLDIVATSVNQNKLVYFLSDGAGGFGPEVAVDSGLLGPGQVVAGDINNDGNLDLASVSYSDNKTVWYSGNGTGTFTMEADIENGSTNGAYYIDLADFDGDTDLDVVVGFANSQTVEIYYNQYIESGTMTVSWIKDTVTVDSGNSYLFGVGFADVDNNGTMDVVVLDNVSGDVDWINKVKNGAATANTISDASIISRPGAFYVADINNDTYNDVIVTDGGSADDAIIWFQGANNASPSATPTLIADNNYQMYDVTVADFDGDADKDIATVGNFSDTVDWFENELITLSLPESGATQFSVYPNPANNTLHFSGMTMETLNLKVFDAVGKLVMSSSVLQNATLDISNLQNGMYLMTFEGSDKTFKFVKQ